MKVGILTILVVLYSAISQAQWQPDVRLTNDAAYSYTGFLSNSWCVKATSDTVHVVWNDNRHGQMNLEIYYKRSIDGGVTWGPDVRLTNSLRTSQCQSLLVSGSDVHVIWDDSRDGNEEMYYKRSPDGGNTWEEDTRLTFDGNASRNPSAAVSGRDIFVVWDDTRPGDYEIYFKRSTDGGRSWEADRRLTENRAISDIPCIGISGSNVIVVWRDNRDGNSNEKIYYKRSTDKGLNWGPDIRLSDNFYTQWHPSISMSGSDVHVVWQDYRDGGGSNGEVYYKHSIDGGTSWGPDTRLTDNGARSRNPTISVSGSLFSPDVHVVWHDERDGNWEVYYKFSGDNGLTWGPDTRLTFNSAESSFPFVSAAGKAVHIVWQDDRDGNYEIYYKRNPAGGSAGIPDGKNFNPIKVYPNPSSGNFLVEWTASRNTDTKIEIVNILGEKVWGNDIPMEAGTSSFSIEVSLTVTGIYFLRITSHENQVIRKILIQ